VAEFVHYFDSGILVKIYHYEPGSEKAAQSIQRAGPVPLPFLAEMEMRNALRVLRGRDLMAEETLNQALSLMDVDIRMGRLVRLLPDSAKVASTAEKLSKHFAASTLCRTLDLLHVAYAMVLKASIFHTGDKRQASLCRKAGLKVSFVKQ